MKISSIVLGSVFVFSAMATQLASAATTGTITFNGALVADTCVINGGGTNNFTVTLPSVQTSGLATAGQTAGDTPFAIVLTGCSPSVPVRAYFSSASGIDGSTGRLISTGAATNVALQLLNSSGVPLALNAANAGLQGDTLKSTDALGAATLNYTARYYSTGVAGAGSVRSSVTYEIVYN